MFKHRSIPSRLLALSILASLILLAVIGVVVPLRERFVRLDEEITRQEIALAQFQQRAASIDELRGTLRKIRNRSLHQGTYINARARSLAEAKLQEIVKESIARSGGRLVSTQVVSFGRNEIERPVTLRAQTEISIGGLRRMLYRLESGSPYLFINNLSIRPGTGSQQEGRRGRKDPETPKQLVHVQYDVSGYLKERSVQ